jgi:hypothetical protein
LCHSDIRWNRKSMSYVGFVKDTSVANDVSVKMLNYVV